MNTIAFSDRNNVINSYNVKNNHNSLNKKINTNRNIKNKKFILSNNNKSTSEEKNKIIYNKILANDNISISNCSMNNNNQGENSLKGKYIKQNTIDDNRNKNAKTQKRPLLFLDLYQNNKVNNYNNSNDNYITTNTETSLNSLIKVNIRLNKEFIPMNHGFKRKNIMNKKNKINKEIKDKLCKKEENEQNLEKINKIILIQKWWKNYFFHINRTIKVENFIICIKNVIYKNLLRLFYLYFYNVKYYFLKWFHITFAKKILEILIIKRESQLVNQSININKKININQINMKNSSGAKSQQNLKKIKNLNNLNISQKVNKSKLFNNINKNGTNDNFLFNHNCNHSNLLERRIPTSSDISKKIHNIISQQKRTLDKNNNKIKSNSNKKNKNKLIFNTMNANNINKINNIIKTHHNKELKTNNNINRTKKILRNKYLNNNVNNNYYKFSNYNFKKEDNKLTNSYNNNKTLRNSNYIKISNTFSNQKNDIDFNDIIINTNDFYISTNDEKLNTEPNNNVLINDININNNISNTINISKRKNKIKNPRYFKLKKCETCPLSFKNKKNNLYSKILVKKYLKFWNIITIKRKILNYLVKVSEQIKLRNCFHRYIKYILLKSLNIILLRKYFNKYKDIIIRRIILEQIIINKRNNNININKVRYYKNNQINYNGDVKVGEIINNININNFINYTNNNINNFIPNTTKNYNIVSNSNNINSHSYYKPHMQYFNNFNNFDETNLINSNYELNNNYNLNYNINRPRIYLNKKYPNGILVNQINQFKMVFNILEQHIKIKKPDLRNLFNKWKNISLKNKISNNNVKKINEKIINFRKNKNIKDKQFNLKNDDRNKYDIKNISLYTQQPTYEIRSTNDIKLSNNKNLYSSRQSNNIFNNDDFNINTLNRNNNKIRYIDITKINFDNYSESSIFNKKTNSEIIYHKKILDHKHKSNINNLTNFNAISKNKYEFKKINKIEEREVHFNSLNKNKNNTNNLFNNNYYMKNYNTNNNYGNINDYSDKKRNLQFKINISAGKNLFAKEKNEKGMNLFNDIKNSFSKNIKIEIINKKVNQTFCGFPINFQDEID